MQTLNEKPLSKRMIAVVLLMAIATVLALSLFVMVQPVFADETSDNIVTEVKSGITTISDAIKAIVNPIAITAAVICGIFLIVGSDPATLKKVKTWLISIIAGLLLVNLSGVLVQWASNIGK